MDHRIIDLAIAGEKLLERVLRCARLKQRRAKKEANLGMLLGLLHQLFRLEAGGFDVSVLERVPRLIDAILLGSGKRRIVAHRAVLLRHAMAPGSVVQRGVSP